MTVAADDVGTRVVGKEEARGLARRVEATGRRRRLLHWALIAPSVVFIAVFFTLPIAAFLFRSVDNAEVVSALPQTAKEMVRWDGAGLPSEAAYAALAADLKALSGNTGAAALGRRLNYNLSGFRGLVTRTASRLPAEPSGSWVETLTKIDRRWGETPWWTVLRNESGRFTPFYLLSAVDLDRGEQGAIVAAPADRALFLDLLQRTVWISGVVTLFCLVLGFPVAYTMANSSVRTANWMMVLILLPFWTSLLVRTTSWVVLLQREGLVNQTLLWLGAIGEPATLVYNRLGVYIAMTHVLLPFLVLPLYSVMSGISRDYMKAAAGLGAPPLTVFRRIYLPQVMPGIVAGCSLVFILALGYYITPALVGGPRDQMISYFIAYFTADSVNWGVASALSVMLLGVVVLLYAVLAKTVGLDRLKVR